MNGILGKIKYVCRRNCMYVIEVYSTGNGRLVGWWGSTKVSNQNDKLNKENDESVAEISISERVTRWEKDLDLRSMKLPVTLASHQLSVAKDYLVKIISADHTSAPLYRKRYSIHTAVADMNIWVLRHDKVWIPILWDQVFLRQKFSFHPLLINHFSLKFSNLLWMCDFSRM